MFTGIIKEVGTVKKATKTGGGRKFSISCELASQIEVDQSININGVCHTAVAADEVMFTVQSVEETLRKTNIGEIKVGDYVNLERSLHPKQLLDGHLVQGHIDTTGVIKEVAKEDSDHIFTISIPAGFSDLIVGRGSITVDGVSLTVAEAGKNIFTAAIIPFTFENTVMKYRKTGDRVNIEFDILGKYVVRYLRNNS